MPPTPELDLSVCSPIVSLKNQLQSKWNLIFSKTSDTAWISFKPQLGLHVYPCYACRDMFVSKVTFQDHANRRVIVIKYDCGECNQTFTFYNRCSFLLHARSHFALDEGKIDLNNIEIYNMPFGMMGFLPHPGINILFDGDEDTIEENCYVNAQFYSPDENERGKQIVTLRPNDLLFCGAGEQSVMVQLTLKQISTNIPLCQFVTIDCQKKLKQNIPTASLRVKEELPDPDDNSQSSESPPAETLIQLPVISKIESLSTDDLSTYPKCPECKQTQRCPMQMHFIGRNIPFDEKLKCSLCKYVSSTRCSYSAHERIHSNTSPFICPECGKKFESREYLMKHLDDVCFHLAKQVRIRCPGKKCGKLFATPTTFSVHFGQHIKSWQQCSVCKQTFENMLAFSEHAKIHSNLCSPDKVYKCLGCKIDGCIIFEDNVKQHLDYHTGDRSRYMYVFVCKFCRNYFRSTATYAAHLLKCQKMQTMRKQVNSYSVDLCVQCHSRIIFYDGENTVACTKCRYINSLYQSQNDNSTTSANIQAIKEKSITPKVHVCLLCREEYPIDQKEEHQSNCMYGTPQVVVEKLHNEISQCSFTSLDDTAIEYENSEASEKKSSSESDMKDTSMEQTDIDCSLKLIKNVSPTTQDSLKKKRKRAPFVFRTKKVFLSSPPEKIIDLQAEEPKPFDGTYYCKMCEFQDSERDKFHHHIISHRHIPTDYQCMECGECFVVKPSLIKHLKHYHKIEDTNSYLETNNCYDKNAVDELKEIMKLAPGESRDPVKENQCRVCLQEFPDEPELKKHFRIHGMAFLLRNSRDGA
ncbi:zinc finger protein 532-like [Coccinella septempunctata]|uniref:zinc finger protein 532-like n=1 Tax=Coccinella septempunctata TaxID=41139 RepID=UPI001D07486E|nr:zinc finger protein 532-like [Coccinella septempunctata]